MDGRSCGFTLAGPLIDGQNAIDALYDWVEWHLSGGGGGGNDPEGQRHDWIDKPNEKGKYWPPTGEKCPAKPSSL